MRVVLRRQHLWELPHRRRVVQQKMKLSVIRKVRRGDGIRMKVNAGILFWEHFLSTWSHIHSLIALKFQKRYLQKTNKLFIQPNQLQTPLEVTLETLFHRDQGQTHQDRVLRQKSVRHKVQQLVVTSRIWAEVLVLLLESPEKFREVQ